MPCLLLERQEGRGNSPKRIHRVCFDIKLFLSHIFAHPVVLRVIHEAIFTLQPWFSETELNLLAKPTTHASSHIREPVPVQRVRFYTTKQLRIRSIRRLSCYTGCFSCCCVSCAGLSSWAQAQVKARAQRSGWLLRRLCATTEPIWHMPKQGLAFEAILDFF